MEHRKLQNSNKWCSGTDTLHGEAPPHFMLCQLQNGVISDGYNSQFRDREDLTLHSQWEGMYQVHHINPRDPS